MLRDGPEMERQADEVHDLLQTLDLLQYYESFRREGFERLESLADIQESDFEALGVKRGHRRLIHRRALELVGPQRYGRDLPPISPPLLAPHPHQPPGERAPSPMLEEGEPLTAYLHRKHPQTRQPRPPQHHPTVQPHAAPAPPPARPYYHPAPYYYHSYTPLPRSQGSQRTQPPQPPPQQQQQRQPVPFPKIMVDTSATVPSGSAARSPDPVPSGARSLPAPSLRPSMSPTVKGTTAFQELRIATGISQQRPDKQGPLTQSSAQSQQPMSSSTDASTPRAQQQQQQQPRADAAQAASGVRLQPGPLAGVAPMPSTRQRLRGYSMSSSFSAVAGSTGPSRPASAASRRRSSRADPRIPYTRPSGEASTPGTSQAPPACTSPQSPKRTYRRHPKKDPNAPEKWRSAYQLFRDDVNRELHGHEIPFAEMSKIHSKRWAGLDDNAREAYFRRSKEDKDEYAKLMTVYEQTPEFKYEEYLDEFYKQDSAVNRVGRPKGARSAKGKGKAPDTGPAEGHGDKHSPDSDSGHSDGMSTSSPSPS